jgi:methylmalonyl-CoA mutase N-terminal domain/subunit
MRLVTDTIEFCSHNVPLWNTISVSGYHIREAGATAAQEVAFTLANAEAYVVAGLEAGLEVDEFAPRISFFFSAHNDLLEEVAKFRAARKIWARMIKESYGARKEESAKLRFHTQTAGSTLTAQQPENNVVRVAYQALAAVLGGTQSLHTNSRDEALALPTEDSARLALRTQQILAHETGVAESADPLGGSWLVERLTLELQEEAEAYLEKIGDLGGVLNAIESGFIQKEIQDSAYERQRNLEKGSEIVVGMNRFVEEPVNAFEILNIDRNLEEKQAQGLLQLKDSRDNSRCRKALDQVRITAGTKENLMPSILEAVQADATVGEVSETLAEVFGKHREIVVI